MELKLITFAKFAESIGVSRQAIYKNVKSGLLPSVDENGKQKIDLNDRQVQEYLKGIEDKNSQFPKQEKQEKQETRQSSKTKIEPKLPTGQSSTNPDDEIPDYIIEMIDSGNLTTKAVLDIPKVWMEKLKIHEDIKSKKQKLRQERKELVSAKYMKMLFGKIHQIDIDQLVASKTKIAAKMASLFNCVDPEKITKAEEEIDDELYRALNSIQDEINRFLKKIGEDEI